MKPVVKKYRRHSDGAIVEAMQYVLDGTPPISAIAQFVLNLDVDAQVTVANERILDVVSPVIHQWRPHAGVATMEVIDPGSGLSFELEVNDWIARCNGQLIFIKPGAFVQEYAEIPPEAPRTEFDELADIIYGSFHNLEGELYQALAEKAATAVIRAGWSKRGRETP